MNYAKELAEVRQACWSKRPKDSASRGAFLQHYINTRYEVFGLSSPTQRDIAKQGFSWFDRSPQEIGAIWKEIWQTSDDFDVLSQALIYYQNRKRTLTLADWRLLKTWVARIDNWAHSDMLSDLLARLRETFPAQVHAHYQTWNRSKHPWAVRQSLVGTFYYARSRRVQPEYSEVMALIDGAFNHPDVYVQKGVGWTLRECFQVYPKPTYQFLLDHAVDLSPTAWQAATEKLSAVQKNRLKTLRLQGRKPRAKIAGKEKSL